MLNIERVVSESPWKRTRIYLVDDNEAAVLIETRGEGSSEWAPTQGFLLTRDVVYAAHDLFQDWPT